MKHKASMYANVLADMDVKKFNVPRFFKVLEKNGDTKQLREIMALAGKLALKKQGNKKVILESARKIQKPAFAKSFGLVKGDVVEERINPLLIAGIKIMVDGEKQLDFSLKNKLDAMFK